MPTFRPPTTAGLPAADPSKTDVHNRHWRFFGAWDMGKTVWKDAQGAWHEAIFPYQGGGVHRTFDGGVLVSETVESSVNNLADAQEVYLGGHVYPITDAKADELIAAGFVVGGHWDEEEELWVTYAIGSVNNKAYKGGDNCASLDRGDGTSLWVFADNLIGTVGADGIYVSALPTPNAFFTRTGDVLTQLYPSGDHPAWTNPEGGHWWWAFDLINDGTGVSGGVFIVAWEVTTGGPNHTVVCNELLQLNGFGQVASSIELTHSDSRFHLQSICKDDTSGYHYLAGVEYDRGRGGHYGYQIGNAVFVRLARVPVGSLLSIASAIEYWNGTTWGPEPGDRLRDHHGSPITGAVDITKHGNKWVLLVVDDFDAAITLYEADLPQGPWRKYHVTDPLDNPVPAGAEPGSPAMYAYYQPKFHEHMNPNASNLVASYSRNIFTYVAGQNPDIDTVHVVTFTPQFVYLPAPE